MSETDLACSACHRTLPIEQFKPGRNRCRQCRAASEAAYLATPGGKAMRKASYAAYRASPEGKAMRKASYDAYLATPEGKAMKQIQRHRRRGGMTEGSATPAVFQKMSEVKKCPYCGRKRPPGSRFHIDHIWPLRLGGWNAAWNYVACCRACNLKKGKLSPLAWLEKLSPEHRTSAERAWNKVNRLWRDPPLARADRALVTSTCPPNRR